MKRIIKFRGKDIEHHKWVYGSLIVWPDGETYIADSGKARDIVLRREEVDPDTVGQFTGLYDCRGNGIYDGDILGAKGKVIGWVKSGVRGYCYDVVYVNHPAGESRWTLYSTVKDDYPEQIEVIGNIYDNPELLKGGRAMNDLSNCRECEYFTKKRIGGLDTNCCSYSGKKRRLFMLKKCPKNKEIKQ